MLSEIFAKVLNMSLTASLVIVLVLMVRLALRKAPKVFSYALWAVVLFRLLCPVSLPAPISMLGLLNAPVSDTPGLTNVEYVPVRFVLGEPSEFSQQAPIQTPAAAAQPMNTARIFAGIWLVGCAAMAIAGIGSYLRFRLRLAGAVRVRNNIYQVDHVETAFVAGLFRPRIYVPFGLSNSQMRYIVAHERCHIRRKDHITRHLAFAALCIHWFNPLVWVAFTLSGRDMEMSCDEAVIRRLGDRIRAPYAQSLLNLATNHARIPGTPIAFGEVDTGARIRNIAGWRQPKKWVSAVSMLLCLTTLTACAMNPTQKMAVQNREIQKQAEPPQETEITPIRNADSVSNMLDTESEVLLYGSGYSDYVKRLVERYENTSLKTERMTYTLYDLNGDGIEELIVCSSANLLMEIVTMKDGETVHYFDSRNLPVFRINICENNIIEINDSDAGISDSGETVHRRLYFQTGMDGVTFVTGLFQDRNGGWNQYLEFPEEPDPKAHKLKPITSEEAQAILETYQPLTVDMKSINDFLSSP